ncbi:DUF2066 domain-containing protein [Marinobacteraceae bacterium S3BR75-40.1]
MSIRRAIGLLVLGFLAVFAAPSQAVPVDGLYDATVVVPNTSEASREPAMTEALKKVLVRVTGSDDVLQNEGAGQLLERAGSLVQAYRYEAVKIPPKTDQSAGEGASTEASAAKERLELVVSFGSVGVNRALAEIGAKVWGANRPIIMVWMAVNNREGRFLAGTRDGSWVRALRAQAQRRGVPVQMPEADALERGDLSLSEIWGGFMGALEGASSGYRYDYLALVRVQERGDQWFARWSLNEDTPFAEGEVQGDSIEALNQALVAAWARHLADRYAVSASELQEEQTVDLVVDQIKDLTSYAQVRRALSDMTPVVDVNPVLLAPESLRLRVSFKGELRVLQEYLALDHRFEKIQRSEPESYSFGEVIRELPVSTTGDEPGTLPPLRQPTPRMSENGTGAPSPEASQESESESFKRLHPLLEYRWRGKGQDAESGNDDK